MTAPMPTLTDETAWPDTTLDSLRIAVLTEQERRRTVATAQAQTDAIADSYASAVAGQAAIPWADVPTAIGPGVQVVWSDGATYTNISRAWLPNTATPVAYPLGWAKAGAPTAPWAAGVAYTVGQQVTYQGHTYQCAQAHTSQTGWEPPATPALWTQIA